MQRREKVFWLLAGLAMIVGVMSLIPAHYEICEVSEKTKEEHCASYQVAQFLGIKIPQILDRIGGVLTAFATVAIAAFTLTLKRATDRLWDAGERQLDLAAQNSAAQSRDMQASIKVSESAVMETRRIGEAQVRAYVSIKAARIDFWSEYAHPLVAFIPTNSGQSPARDFIWNISIQYVGDTVNRSISFSDNWLNVAGIDIPAGTDGDQERAHISYMSARRYISDVNPKVDICLVRVKIDFRYTDVFGRHWFGEDYLASIIKKTGDQWSGDTLAAMPKPADWASIPEGQKD